MTLDEVKTIVFDCRYLIGWDILVKLDNDRPYLQISVDDTDNFTGLPLRWTGRKWVLSYHMCKNEIVNTAYKAIETDVMHELRENFLYKNTAIFNPHIDPDKLVDFVNILIISMNERTQNKQYNRE